MHILARIEVPQSLEAPTAGSFSVVQGTVDSADLTDMLAAGKPVESDRTQPSTLLTMPAVDRFPSTHGTWLSAHIDTIMRAAPSDGGACAGAAHADVQQSRRALREHLMRRYAGALSAYASGPHFRRLGEPDDLVGGFFARVLSDDEFLPRWRQSGLPLRRWLMNAMSFHCRGIARDRARERARTADGRAQGRISDGGLPADLEADAERTETSLAFDRAWALALLNEAYARLQDSLREEGRVTDDAVLRMHVMERMTYEQVAGALGISRKECFNAMRRVAPRVRATLRELLRDEGVDESELGAQLELLAKALAGS